jgi:hypothetical protein
MPFFSGSIKFSSIYVALSRVRSLQSVGILRPFEKEVLKAKPNADLLAEMKRLETLCNNTKQSYSQQLSKYHTY